MAVAMPRGEDRKYFIKYLSIQPYGYSTDPPYELLGLDSIMAPFPSQRNSPTRTRIEPENLTMNMDILSTE